MVVGLVEEEFHTTRKMEEEAHPVIKIKARSSVTTVRSMATMQRNAQIQDVKEVTKTI